MDSKELGRCGERLAAGYLSSHGYRLVEMNYRCRFGELDIVARRDDMVIFAEVKTRRSGRFGRPGMAVDVEHILRHRVACLVIGIRQQSSALWLLALSA